MTDYDLGKASSILNVQPNWAVLVKTLADIAAATKADGRSQEATSPWNYSGLNAARSASLLRKRDGGS